MVDYYWDGDCVDKAAHFLQNIGFKIDYDMPSLGKTAGHFQEFILGRIVHVPFEKIETHGANASVVQLREFLCSNRRVDDCNSACLAI